MSEAESQLSQLRALSVMGGGDKEAEAPRPTSGGALASLLTEGPDAPLNEHLNRSDFKTNRGNAKALLKRTKSMKARSLLRGVIGQQMIVNAAKKVEGATTIHVGGLSREMEEPAALIRRFSDFGHVAAVTIRERREKDKVSWALLSFSRNASMVLCLKNHDKLLTEKLVVKAIDLNQAVKSTGMMHATLTVHKEKLTGASAPLLSSITTPQKPAAEDASNDTDPHSRWQTRMGLKSSPERAASPPQLRTTATVYADAVLASHLPERERQINQRARRFGKGGAKRMSQARMQQTYGKVVTLKEERRFDAARAARARGLCGNEGQEWDVRLKEGMRMPMLLRHLRNMIGETEDGAILCLVTTKSNLGNRAMGRHVISVPDALVHGQTYLIRRGTVSAENLLEADEEERVVTLLQRHFRARAAARCAEDEATSVGGIRWYSPGWGLATPRERQAILMIQVAYRRRLMMNTRRLKQKLEEVSTTACERRPSLGCVR